MNSTNLIQPTKMYDMLRLCLSSNTITESPQHTKYIFLEPNFLIACLVGIIFYKNFTGMFGPGIVLLLSWSVFDKHLHH